MRVTFPVLLLLVLSLTSACAGSAKRAALPNGMRLLLKPDGGTDIVAIDLLLDISILDEPADKAGLRYLTHQLLMRGTDDASGDEMNDRLAAVGGVADAAVGLDYVEIYSLVPSDGFELALGLLADAVRRPSFLPEEVAKQKQAAAEALSSAPNDPFQEGYLAFRNALYGPHPYARATFGDAEGLASLTRQEIAAYHSECYRPDRAVLAICGSVGEMRALRAVRGAFGDWTGPPSRPRPPATFEPPVSSWVAAREAPVRSAHLILGFPAPAAGDPSYYAVQVMDSLLSGGASARLPRALRDERGLVYHISSFYPTLACQSHFVVYASAEPYQAEDLKNAILEALTAVAQGEATPDETEHAKRYLLGSYAVSHQRLKEQAYALAWYEVLGLGEDFEQRYAESVQAVTPSQVQQAARDLLRNYVVAVVMPGD